MSTSLLANKRIFLVEDDFVNIHIFTKVLAKYNAQVFHNSLGLGAEKQILELLPIDLIVLDIMLQRGQNGFDIFTKIREEPKLRSIKIIGTSSLDPEVVIPKAREAGFTGFISKPVDALILSTLLEKALRGEPVWVGNDM
jgi:two-component system CheB/CheR fusion protein